VETVQRLENDRLIISKEPIVYDEIKPGEFKVEKVDVPYQTTRA